MIHSNSGKKAVVISANDETGQFTANVYVNCNPVFKNTGGLGDITLVRKTGSNLAKIETWSVAQVSA